MKATRCAVSGCDGTDPITKGYCESHYKRWCRTGDPGTTPILRRKRKVRDCSVVDCPHPHRANGYCKLHYERWYWRNRLGQDIGDVGGDRRTSWATKPGGYTAVHQRLTRERGPAREYECLKCGNIAAHWAYNSANPDPHEKLDSDKGLFYTYDLSYYIPLCVPCHSRLDRGDRSTW